MATGMKRTLAIAPNLLLPAEAAVTSTFGILAKRGAGKSNAAAVMAEEMHAAGHQFVAVDPVGAWWGLRSSSDGKGVGLPIPILGGYRGDVPLEPTAGELIADLVVDERLSCVLDVSAFESESAKRRFLIAFAERLFRQKGRPGHEDPLHLFLEEADDYAPQRAAGIEMNRCLGAFQRMVKRGRGRGIGATMITQRSAALNKDLLTQIDTLIVLRTTSPNDRKAIEGWVTYHDIDGSLLASLSELKTGEAWVWSPEFLELVERVKIRRRRTFDSGATPTGRSTGRAPATLADVDLGALEARMKETIERAKAEDPKELRRRIAELERTLKTLEHRPSSAETVTVEVPVEVLVEVARIPPAVVDALGAVEAFAGEIGRAVGHIQERLASANSAAQAADGARERSKNVSPSVGKRAERAMPGATGRGAPTPMTPRAPDAQKQASSRGTGSRQRPSSDPAGEPVRSDSITGPQQRVLDALAWLEGIGLEGERVRVGFLSGYRKGGRFNDVVSSCKTSGLIDYPRSGVLELTPEGRALATPLDIPATTESVQAAVMARLNGPQRRVLQPLIDAYPDEVGRQELAPASGYQVGGRFSDVVSSLRSLGLIDYPSQGWVVALPVLFLEGR